MFKNLPQIETTNNPNEGGIAYYCVASRSWIDQDTGKILFTEEQAAQNKPVNDSANSEISATVHYLFMGWLNSLDAYNEEFPEKSTCIGDLLGYGEDCFIMELWPLAEHLEKIYEELYREYEEGGTGIWCYDFIEGVAGKKLFEMTIINEELPSSEVWDLNLRPLVKNYLLED